MKKLLFLSLLLVWGCKDTNSNSYDKDKYYDDVGIPDSSFRAAYKVMQTRCMNCHYHQGWSAYKTPEQWVQNQLVVLGDETKSAIIYRTINSKSAQANMPEGSTTGIPGDEFQKLLDWVKGL